MIFRRRRKGFANKKFYGLLRRRLERRTNYAFGVKKVFKERAIKDYAWQVKKGSLCYAENISVSGLFPARNIGDDLEKSWNRIKPLHCGCSIRVVGTNVQRMLHHNTDVISTVKENIQVYGGICDDGDQKTSTGEEGYAIDENQLAFNMPQFTRFGRRKIYKHYKANCKQSMLLNNAELKRSFLGMLEKCDGDKHPFGDDVCYILPDVAGLRNTMLNDLEICRVVVTLEIVTYATYYVYNPKYVMNDEITTTSTRLKEVANKDVKEKKKN